MQTLRPHAKVDRADVLRRTELFCSLPEDVLRKVAGLATIRRLGRGEMLYSEHDEATGLFIVAEGELRSIREGLDGREQVLSTERLGATLSEVSVFGGGQYFSTVLAETPSTVLCIHHHEIRQICDEHPELLWKVAKVLSARRGFTDTTEAPTVPLIAWRSASSCSYSRLSAPRRCRT